jgi:hypothetical protein
LPPFWFLFLFEETYDNQYYIATLISKLLLQIAINCDIVILRGIL